MTTRRSVVESAQRIKMNFIFLLNALLMDRMISIEHEKSGEIVSCKYKGIERRVHLDVCRWHWERKDKECEKCGEAKKLKGQS